MWLLQELQNNLLNPESNNNYLRIRNVLDSMSIDYTLIYYNSKRELRVLNSDFVDNPDSEEILKARLSSPYILHGSVSLDRHFKNDKNNLLGKDSLYVDFANITNILDEKEILNIPIVRGKLKDLYPIDDEFFMRPVKDDKAITGGVFTEGQLFAMKKTAKENNNTELLNSELIITRTQPITSEYRFFIINRKIITYSSYMINNRFNINEKVPTEAIKYVNSLLSAYNMGVNYVVDIAEVNGEYKVLEFNGVVASGLYNCDEYKIVHALNNLL